MDQQLPFFVYGTLRAGQGNHRVVADALEDVLEARLPGHQLFAFGLPYIAPAEDPGVTVTGDLLLVRPGDYDRALRRLDRLEGYDPPRSQMYVRARCRAQFRAGPGEDWQERDAWVYLGGMSFDYSPALAVASGDFAAVARWA
jgi:gamma-glutamylcyclotransferase (GGCT)/AIG2-like uncharacterized protein YtfP